MKVPETLGFENEEYREAGGYKNIHILVVTMEDGRQVVVGESFFTGLCIAGFIDRHGRTLRKNLYTDDLLMLTCVIADFRDNPDGEAISEG